MTKKKTKTKLAGVGAAIWAGPENLRAMLQPVDALRLDPRNPRKHDDRNLEAIRASLFEFGQLRPVVVQEATMQVVAGNGTLQAAKLAGWTHVAALVAPLTDAQARAFAIADNRTAELAAWDSDNLAAALADPELDALLGATGFSAAEIEKLIGSDAGGVHVDADPATRATVRDGGSIAGDDDDDDEGDEAGGKPAADDDVELVPEPPKEPKTKRGDVWECGDHLVLCADSFEDEAADFIGSGKIDAVVTDPPYAIFGSSTGVSSDVADDRMVRPFFEKVCRLIVRALKKHGHAYLFTDYRSWAALWDGARTAALSIRNALIWDKGSGLGANYMIGIELIAFAHNRPAAKSAWLGREAGVRPVNKPNVFRVPRPSGDDRHHHASKPVQLLQQLIENSTDKGETVLEPFGGGGSTLIACEQSGRRCRLVEVEPKWCDVIVARWEKLTGRQAKGPFRVAIPTELRRSK